MYFEAQGHILLHHLEVMDNLELLLFALKDLLDLVWVLQE